MAAVLKSNGAKRGSAPSPELEAVDCTEVEAVSVVGCRGGRSTHTYIHMTVTVEDQW